MKRVARAEEIAHLLFVGFGAALCPQDFWVKRHFGFLDVVDDVPDDVRDEGN